MISSRALWFQFVLAVPRVTPSWPSCLMARLTLAQNQQRENQSLHTSLPPSIIANGLILLINTLFYISQWLFCDWILTDALSNRSLLYPVPVCSAKTKFSTFHCSKINQWDVSVYNWMGLLGNWERCSFCSLKHPLFFLEFTYKVRAPEAILWPWGKKPCTKVMK